MKIKRWKSILALLLITTLFLAGCGDAASQIAGQYPFENVVQGDFGTAAKVYRATNQGVTEVAKQIASSFPPVETSAENEERMFLVYQNQLVSLMRDPENPQDTLIEVANQEFVRNNYDFDLLEAYLIASIVDDLFDIGWKLNKAKYKGGYKGYAGPGGYTKYAGREGSLRYGSATGQSPRGGGPGVGK
ncbi:DUF4247 domain-containing protein [Microaerobacter geothermalis]|uniref:DUF4247 domain-containing protein n=1 Tax=Microaerobacter geothermalis TaxID=674972 RepID=UPI001F35E06B|nr:DUF4247 domain-containing protein [Microaerobacter geothermalis]MCF6092556.1 DUF4247 domain-containing protein [Microaerobacter geothermalis]